MGDNLEYADERAATSPQFFGSDNDRAGSDRGGGSSNSSDVDGSDVTSKRYASNPFSDPFGDPFGGSHNVSDGNRPSSPHRTTSGDVSSDHSQIVPFREGTRQGRDASYNVGCAKVSGWRVLKFD